MDDGEARCGTGAGGCLGGSPGADLARAAFAETSAMTLVIGPGGRCVLVNPAVSRTLGWTAAELAARPFWEVYVAPEDEVMARQAFTLALEQGLAFPQEGDWLDRRGSRRRVLMHNDVVYDDQGRPCAVVTVGLDITAQRRREALLREHADLDPLTGLRNRRAFFDALGPHLHDGRDPGYGLLFCDVDGLKAVNDTYGHATGDLLIKEVARRLQEITGMGDVVARFGGDEFVVLCPHADEQRLAAVAETIHTAMRDPLPTEGGPLRIGVSTGWSASPEGADADSVIRAADCDMYRMKATHRRAPDPP